MAQLPLKIRVGLRDHWEKANSPVRESISALSEVVGLPVDVALEAPMLWRELGKHYSDPEIFVPTIAEVVKSWTECMNTRLGDDAHAAWTEQLLETCGRSLKVQVDTRSGSRVRTKWENTTSSFIISIPESPPPYPSVSSSITTDLENLFNTTSTKDVPLQSKGIDDEGRADEERPSNREISPKQNLRIRPQTLPQLDTLARPDTLFVHQIPYHMTVKMTQSGILVQGSHHPSLDLLAGYFSKWTRTLKGDTRKIPLLKVELQESNFGLGLLFDAVTIEPVDERRRWPNVNPILVVAFIESVLGYQSVPERRNEDDFYFKRDERFR